jgi:LysR family hydrogen peroxide-inducible transcriptional activator
MAQPSPEPGLPYLDLALLKDRSFIKMPPAQKFSKMGDSLCEKAGFVPRVVCELMSWDAINRLIGSGMGVGFVPGIIIGTLSPENSPNYYKIKSIASSMRPYAVAYSKNRLLSDASRTTIEQLRICLNSTEANKAGMPQYRFDS